MDISPNGDIILVVEPQNMRLMAHSQFLGYATKVFNVMTARATTGVTKLTTSSRWRARRYIGVATAWIRHSRPALCRILHWQSMNNSKNSH